MCLDENFCYSNEIRPTAEAGTSVMCMLKRWISISGQGVNFLIQFIGPIRSALKWFDYWKFRI